MPAQLDPVALRLPAGPLLAAVDRAAHGRGRNPRRLLGEAGHAAYRRVRRAGTASLRQVEDLCDRLGCHPFELYGQAYQRLALAAVPEPLTPNAVVTAWHQAACGRPGCDRPIHPGELVGLVGEIGACCAACCDLTPAQAEQGRGAA
jgi:hypothetical protein